MKAKLASDVVSVFHERHEVPDKKSKNGFIAIVENKKGARFAARTENLILNEPQIKFLWIPFLFQKTMH
jgi:hypothetical protein